MSYISKYVESLMSKTDKKQSALTTKSLYYEIGNVIIRISDHFASPSQKPDIDIVNPLNAKTLYLVQVKDGPQLLQFKLAELKAFIKNFLYIQQIKSLNAEVQTNKKVVSKKLQENKAKAQLPSMMNKVLPWSQFVPILTAAFPDFKHFKNKRRAMLRNRFVNYTVAQAVKELELAKEAGFTKNGVSYSALGKFLKGLK